MTAELIAQSGDHLMRETTLDPGIEPFEQGNADCRYGHSALECILDRPAAGAGVVDPIVDLGKLAATFRQRTRPGCSFPASS